jgi:hypothetical protein
MLIPVSLALVLFGQRRHLRLLSAASLVLGGVVLLLTQSLQALLGLSLGILLIAAWRSRWALLSVPVLALALGGVLWATGPDRAVRALLSLDDRLGIGVLLRLDIWSRAWAMIRDMPYTGVGLNTFPLVQTHFYPGVLLGPEAHAHNLFLQTAVDLGLPGLVAFVWLSVVFLLMAIRACRTVADSDLRTLLVGLVAGFVAYVGNGLVDAVTLGAKPVVALFAMLGLAVAIARVGRKSQAELGESGPPAQPRRAFRDFRARRARPVALILALAVLCLIAWPASAALNSGAIRAHRLVFEARQSGSLPTVGQRAALAALELAARRTQLACTPDELLGILHAWRGEDKEALDALGRAVAADGAGSVGRYAPWLPWQRGLEGRSSPGIWWDLVQVYAQWMHRYPERAETYVRLALVYDRHLGDPGTAKAVLRSGQELGAAPAGLLTYYLSLLEL